MTGTDPETLETMQEDMEMVIEELLKLPHWHICLPSVNSVRHGGLDPAATCGLLIRLLELQVPSLWAKLLDVLSQAKLFCDALSEHAFCATSPHLVSILDKLQTKVIIRTKCCQDAVTNCARLRAEVVKFHSKPWQHDPEWTQNLQTLPPGGAHITLEYANTLTAAITKCERIPQELREEARSAMESILISVEGELRSLWTSDQSQQCECSMLMNVYGKLYSAFGTLREAICLSMPVGPQSPAQFHETITRLLKCGGSVCQLIGNDIPALQSNGCVESSPIQCHRFQVQFSVPLRKDALTNKAIEISLNGHQIWLQAQARASITESDLESDGWTCERCRCIGSTWISDGATWNFVFGLSQTTAVSNIALVPVFHRCEWRMRGSTLLTSGGVNGCQYQEAVAEERCGLCGVLPAREGQTLSDGVVCGISVSNTPATQGAEMWVTWFCEARAMKENVQLCVIS